MTDNPNSAKDHRIPVTLLTGFLGAGKTTLLNAVLSNSNGGRIAVIVNEFGEAGLDHDLIETSSDEIILMQSGCLCCSIRGDLAQTIAGLMARWSSGELTFERIVIETTGLADPAPIMQTLQLDPGLFYSVRLDGIVTVADAAAGPGTLDAQFEAVSQVAMADLLVISKADIVSKSELQAFEARLGQINPTARLIRAKQGKVPSGALWGLGTTATATSPTAMAEWLTPRPTTTADDPLANLSGLAPTAKPQKPETHSHHDHRIGSASIIIDKPIPEVVFDLWLDTLVGLRGPDLLRVKGIVFLEDMDLPFVFHGVQHVFEPPIPLKDWPNDDCRSRIVVIARDMSRPELQHSLNMLRGDFSQPAPQGISKDKTNARH